MLCKRLVYGSGEATIVIDDCTEEAIKKTCFRGQCSQFAGNFCKWSSLEELLTDSIIRNELFNEMKRRKERQEFGTTSIQINYGSQIGWARVDKVGTHSSEELEEFHPNPLCTAFGVKRDRMDILTPLTCQLTFLVESKLEESEFIVAIHGVYPGENMGVPVGNLTSDKGVIFFDWNHPGVTTH